MIPAPSHSAAFEVESDGRSRLIGSLHFNTVGALLEPAEAAIKDGRAAIIELSAVTESDSAGLALLLEYLSIAKRTKRALRLENIPEQLLELARLSDVDALLTTGIP